MDELVPLQIEKSADRKLVITWNDGVTQKLAFRKLRDQCQCASCLEERKQSDSNPSSALPVLTAAQAQPIDIRKMTPVGNYAYNIQFSDGHSTGIYTLEFLRQLGAIE